MIYYLLLIFCLYLPFQIALNPISGIDLASGRIIILILFLSWIWSSLKNKNFKIPPRIQTLLIISFLFLSFFSLIFAGNKEWYFRKLFFLFSIFPLYFIVAAISDKFERVKKMIDFLIWGAAAAAFVGLVQFSLQFIFGLEETMKIWANFISPFLGNAFSEAVLKNPSWLVGISGRNLFRAISVFPDPHMFSFYLNLILPWTLVFYYKFGRKKYYLVLFFIILFADLATFSRGGYLGLAANLLVGIIFFSKKIILFLKNNKNKYRKWILISATILLIVILFTRNPVSQRFISSFRLEEGSNQGRIETWKSSLAVIVHNPLGVGLGNYSLEIKPSADYREPIYSHNLYLDIAAETGIINALIWLALIITSIFSYIKKAKQNYFYLGGVLGLVSFFAHSFFETPIFSVQVLPLLIIIIALSAIKPLAPNEKNN